MSWGAGFFGDGVFGDAFVTGPVLTFHEPRLIVYREGRMTAPDHHVYHTGSELPSIAIDWQDRTGATIDLSAATFSMKIYTLAGVLDTTKTAGITGSALAPNVVISWDAGELAAIGAGRYTWTLDAIVSGNSRPYKPNATLSLTITELPA